MGLYGYGYMDKTHNLLTCTEIKPTGVGLVVQCLDRNLEKVIKEIVWFCSKKPVDQCTPCTVHRILLIVLQIINAAGFCYLNAFHVAFELLCFHN